MSTFTVYPAIDLLDRQCVRLYQGDYEQSTVYNASPLQQAQQFKAEGAEWLHIVDLNGAKEGARIHADIICEIIEQTSLQVQVGGGIRNEADVAYYLEKGVARVILGSVAITDPDFVVEMVQQWGAERIVVGLDSKKGFVSTHGWLSTSEQTAADVAEQLAKRGVQHFICTDIATDGTLTGPNIELCVDIATQASANVIVSGGVATLTDIESCKQKYAENITGVIVGKALYSNQFTLKQAIEAVK
ncbi:MAG: 1-(5-phosphoribosyl)-5-[(5-phosphoribosylamino)methylideneamino]imidazole-4-carboxamide isomerase [Bacilli bacterium]